MSTAAEVRSRLDKNIPTLESSIALVSAALPLSKSWIDAEQNGHPECPALGLIVAARLSLLETATGWSLGLNRAATSSLRTFVENAISWLYYKDHPVEYSMMARAQAELMLPKDTQKYLARVDLGRDAAYKYLDKTAARPNEYFYTTISAFVHAHPNFIIAGKSAPEMVVSTPPEDLFLQMCSHTDEFVSDQYLTHYRHSWGVVPATVQQHAANRLGAKLADFMAVP